MRDQPAAILRSGDTTGTAGSGGGSYHTRLAEKLSHRLLNSNTAQDSKGQQLSLQDSAASCSLSGDAEVRVQSGSGQEKNYLLCECKSGELSRVDGFGFTAWRGGQERTG